MKTIREWLESIEDETIRQQALDNSETWALDTTEPSLEKSLIRSFVWGNSKQGFAYWDSIYTLIIKGKKI